MDDKGCSTSSATAAAARRGRRGEAWAGLRSAGPVALAMVPLGIAFGLLVLHAGLAWWWATVFSAVVFAGSLEFLLVAMVAGVAPLAKVAVTAVMVNSRHVFYALSFPPAAITGPSGSGKSSLLRILAAQDRPTAGRAEVAGHALTGLSARALRALRRKHIGYVFPRPP